MTKHFTRVKYDGGRDTFRDQAIGEVTAYEDSSFWSISCESGREGVYEIDLEGQFPNRTAEGLGVQSAPEEVVKVLGKPTSDQAVSPKSVDLRVVVYRQPDLDCEFLWRNDGSLKIRIFPPGMTHRQE